MKLSLPLFIIIPLFLSCSNEIDIPAPGQQPNVTYETHPEHARYQKALEQYQLTTQSPGSILLVHRANDPLWIGSSGKSNLEYKAEMRTNTLFRTGSITKMFTAVVILKLSERGDLSLEDRLSIHLPEVNGRIPEADKITIRHLLAHLSGIVDPPNESLRYKADIINDPDRMYHTSIDQLLGTYVYGKALHFFPGTNYSYSNTNYWLLGKIAERITQKSLQQVMSDFIFTPLQMNNTYIDRRDDKDVARGYADLYGNGIVMDVSTWDNAEGNGRADGGLISTASDLYTFMHALFKGSLVQPETLGDMKKIQLSSCNSPDCEYGLGLEIWRMDSGLAYGHNGALVGIEANALFYENSDGISVLYRNKGDGSDKRWLNDIMN
jgi:D-alanyl-D-alanine carboxypeptidase